MFWGYRQAAGELAQFALNAAGYKLAFKFTARFTSLPYIRFKNFSATGPKMNVLLQGVASNGEPDGNTLYSHTSINNITGWMTGTLNATLVIGQQYFIVIENYTAGSARANNSPYYIVVDSYEWPARYEYGDYVDHNWQVYTYTSSWTKVSNAYPCLILQYSTLWDGKAIENVRDEEANYQVGGNECIRQSFYVNTAFYADKVYVLAEVPATFGSPNYPSDHLSYRIMKGATVEASGIMCSTSNADYTSTITDPARWYGTALGYQFSTGTYVLALTSTGAAQNGNYWILSVNQNAYSNTSLSFQGASSRYAYSSDSGQSWTTANILHNLPFKLGVRGVVGTTKSYEGGLYPNEKLCICNSTITPWTNTYYSDHSAYYEIPLASGNYDYFGHTIYDYDFSTVHAGINSSTSANFDSDHNTTLSVKAATGIPSLWWSTDTSDGSASSPGMNYAYREMIKLPDTHDRYPEGSVVDVALKTGNLEKIEGVHLHRTPFMYHNLVYYDNKTHLIYMDDHWKVRGISYNHITEQWYDTATFIADIPSEDAHFTPSVCVGLDGYLHVFYGCHNSEILYRKSSASNSIANWSAELETLDRVSLHDFATYCRPHTHPNGDIYVFCRRYQTQSSYLQFFIKRDVSSPLYNEGWSTAYIPFKYLQTSSPNGSNKSIYIVGTEIDTDGTLHAAWTNTYGYLVSANDMGVMYAYSTSDGKRWNDLKINSPWDAWYSGSSTAVTYVPNPMSYTTVSPVIQRTTARTWGGNHDCMVIDPVLESTPGVKRAYFILGSGDTSDPTLDLRACVAKWGSTAWVVSTVKVNGVEEKPFDAASYNGGMVITEEGTIYYNLGYSLSTTVSWGGGPYITRLVSIDKGSSWAAEPLTGYNDLNYTIAMKKNYSNRQVEAVLINGQDAFYLRGLDRFPYNRPDGQDIRVVYGGNEISRIGDLWNSQSTKIQFKLQEALSTNLPYSTSGNYYIYHGRDAWPT